MSPSIGKTIVLGFRNPGGGEPPLVPNPLNTVSCTGKMQSYLEGAIERLIEACALLLRAILGVDASIKSIVDRFGLGRPKVIKNLCVLGMHGLLEKNVKLFSAWPCARALGNPLPTRKCDIDYEYLFGTQVRRFIVSRVSIRAPTQAPSKKVMTIANSFLVFKDSSRDVSKEFVKQSFIDYKEGMSADPISVTRVYANWRQAKVLARYGPTTPDSVGPPLDPQGGVEPEKEPQVSKHVLSEQEEEGLQTDFNVLMQAIERSIDMTVNEVFHPIDPEDCDDDEVIPSLSSSFSTGRADGGAWQELLKNEGRHLHADPKDNSMFHKKPVPGGVRCNKDDKHPRWSTPYKGEIDVGHSHEVLLLMCYCPTLGVESIYGDICHLTGRFLFSEKASARIAPILEACKVRWVSIGESEPYYRAKAWNRAVYKQMPHHPTFELTGRPLTEEDVNKMVHKYLLSGDYKGATDTLDPVWSEYVLKRITQRIYARCTGDNSHGDWWTRYHGLKAMLVGHRMYYKAEGGEEYSFDQKTGQLMGSFLSFPVLCILNAAINRVYLDPGLKQPIADLPLLVNGDDVMMSSDCDFSDWAAHVALVSLKPSVGKNYVHTHCCCLNSEFYLRSSQQEPFSRVHPIRINLIYGKTKRESDDENTLFGRSKIGQQSQEFSGSLGSKARLLVKHHAPEVAKVLLSSFIDQNIELLKSTQRSWWTPEELGGLGLPLTSDTVRKVSTEARTIATYLMTRPSPEDVLIYAQRDAPESTTACRNWMRACEKLHRARGHYYRWLDPDETELAPPISLRQFVGYGSLPIEGSTTSRYRRLRKLADKTKNVLTPCSDEALLRFAEQPRRAGWALTPEYIVPRGGDPPVMVRTMEDLENNPGTGNEIVRRLLTQALVTQAEEAKDRLSFLYAQEFLGKGLCGPADLQEVQGVIRNTL